jgi:DNA-binding NarL/FixJ family response regulator
MTHPYRVLLAEDHTMFREMIKRSLETFPGVEVAGEVGDGLELLEAVETLKPHLVILDIGLPRKSGLEAAREIKKSHPNTKILLLTMYRTDDHVARAMEIGVDGYLLKDNAFNDLIVAIEAIRLEKRYISNFVMDQMVNTISEDPKPRAERVDFLTTREKEVLRSLAEGKSIKEIAAYLVIKETTVRIHLFNSKKKLHIKRNVELARFAMHITLP